MTTNTVRPLARHASRLTRLICAAVSALLLAGPAIAQDVSADVQFDVLRHRLVEAIKVEDHRTTLKLIADLRAMNRPL